MPDRLSINVHEEYSFLLFSKAFIAKFHEFVFSCFFDGFLENTDIFILAW